MFIKLLDFEWSVNLGTAVLLLLLHRKIAKAKRRGFFNCLKQQPKIFIYLLAQCTTALYNLGIVIILLANT